MMRRALLLVLAAWACGGCATLARLQPYRDPLSAEEHRRLADSYRGQGLAAEAERHYRRSVKREPRSPAGWMAWGNALFEKGEFKQAERCFRKVLRLAPAHAGARNNLAMAYLARGVRLKEAERLATEALADPAMQPYAYETLASLYSRAGRAAEAEEAFAKALAAAPPEDKALLERLNASRRAVKPPLPAE